MTGIIGNQISISGQNFYNIIDVRFTSADPTGVSANFSHVSSSKIITTIPESSAWGPITIVPQVGNPVITSYNFVPFPKIYGFSPISGVTGSSITLSGTALSGVTGVYINNLLSPTSRLTITNNTGLSFVIPSGNTHGYIKLYGQSGTTMLSTTKFEPLAVITGATGVNYRTGDILYIQGTNFWPEILKQEGIGSYLVKFENTTAVFTGIDHTTLYGTIPYGTKDGIINLYQNDGAKLHLSLTGINIINHPPTIAYVSPFSGFTGSIYTVYGENYYDISNVILSGQYTGLAIITNTGSTNDSLSFKEPSVNITGGWYNVIIETPVGNITGDNLIYVRGIPLISGCNPRSGVIGQPISISGRNIYKDSIFYSNGTGNINIIQSVSGSFTTGYNGYNTAQIILPFSSQTGHQIIIRNTVDYASGVFVTLLPRPTINCYLPATGGQYGEQILVSGTNFYQVSNVKIGNFNVDNYSIIGTTGLYFNIPTGINSGSVYISATGGTAYSSGLSVYISPPVVNKIYQNPTFENNTVFLSGIGLDRVTGILLSGGGYNYEGIEQSATLLSNIGSTGLSFLMPYNCQDGKIKVLYQYNKHTYTNENLLIRTINSVSPTSGVYSGLLNIVGTNLKDVTINFTDITGGRLTGISASTPTILSTRIPREIKTAPLILSSGYQSITYETFYPLPTITGFNKTTIQQGEVLTITGINAYSSLPFIGISGSGIVKNVLLNETGFSINISSVTGNALASQTGFVIISGVIGNSFFGTGNLFLTNEYDYAATGNISGSIAFSNSNTIVRKQNTLNIQNGPPTISSISPTFGYYNTEISVNGTNLGNATGAYLSGEGLLSQARITSRYNNLLTIIPSGNFTGKSGQVLVYNQTSHAYSSQKYTYYTFSGGNMRFDDILRVPTGPSDSIGSSGSVLLFPPYLYYKDVTSGWMRTDLGLWSF